MANMTIQNILGDSNNAYIMMEVFRSASNVILSDNPEFTREDFSKIFPVFKLQDGAIVNQDEIPEEVYNLFYNMANASIKYKRYYNSWKYCMCLYIAHYITLFCRLRMVIQVHSLHLQVLFLRELLLLSLLMDFLLVMSLWVQQKI